MDPHLFGEDGGRDDDRQPRSIKSPKTGRRSVRDGSPAGIGANARLGIDGVGAPRARGPVPSAGRSKAVMSGYSSSPS